MNPIYIEYYSHDNASCYKMDLPWSKYHKDTRVLCKVSEGLDMAKEIACGVLSAHFKEALQEEVESCSLR